MGYRAGKRKPRPQIPFEAAIPALPRRQGRLVAGGGVLYPLGTAAMRSALLKPLASLLRLLLDAVRDIVPIVAVVVFFQFAVLRQPLPNLGEILGGLLLVLLGLTFFVRGLEQGLFPLGESMAYDFARKGSVFWLLLFAFCLGFGTTVAEPALIAVAGEAAEAAALAGIVGDEPELKRSYAFWLRMSVATAVGAALILGVIRILRGWPLPYLIIGGYALVVVLTYVAPPEIIGIAYDSGGVTTSTITVPLVTALGVGLATVIKGRNPMIDGFGLIAIASLTPMIFVILFGLAWTGLG